MSADKQDARMSRDKGQKSSARIYENSPYFKSDFYGVCILVEVSFLFQLLGECHCWWTSEYPRAHVAKLSCRLRLIRSVLRASNSFVLKLIEIVILLVCTSSLSASAFFGTFFCDITVHLLIKKEEIWLSHITKALIPTEMSKGSHTNTKTSPNGSITQRLRTDLGRSDRVTSVIQLVSFTGFQSIESTLFG